MATPGELIKTVADVLYVPEVTVASYYRSLREAGLVTKGGRGPSAAQMKPSDAAKLLSAVGGSRFEKETAEKTVRDYSGIKVAHTARCLLLPSEDDHIGRGDWIENNSGTWVFDGFKIEHLQRLPERHTFLDALVAIIDAAMEGEFGNAQRADHRDLKTWHSIEVLFYGPEPRAGLSIKLGGAGSSSYEEEGTYLLPEQIERNSANYSQVDENVRLKFGDGDLEIRRKFTEKTIYSIAHLLKT